MTFQLILFDCYNLQTIRLKKNTRKPLRQNLYLNKNQLKISDHFVEFL
jgi:hypothetical protein